MSTFTDFNGPQPGGMPTTKSILDLVNAYRTMLDSLNDHISQHASSDNNVHNVKDYVAAQLEAINTTLNTASSNADEAIKDLRGEVTTAFANALTAKFTGSAASLIDNANPANNNVIALLYKLWVLITECATDEEMSSLTSTVETLTATIGTIPAGSTIGGMLETINSALNTADTGILARLTAIEAQLASNTFENITVTGTATTKVTAAKLLKALLTRTVYTPNESQLQHLYLGYANSKHWHVLGMLVDNVGSAYIKFADTHNMAAQINFAVSDSDTGIIDVNVTRAEGEWLNTSFALCKATDADQTPRYYICVAKDGLGENQMLAFQPHVSGVNFASPMLSDEYVEPVSDGNATVLTQVDLNNYVPSGHQTSGGSSTSDGVLVGVGVRWPGSSDNVPAKYVYAGGQEVNVTDYPQLAEAWGITTETFVIPAEDHTIFKCEA